MLSATFSIVVPANAPVVSFTDVSTIGTPLEGLQPNAPLVLNLTDDAVAVSSGSADGVPLVRASAADTLRIQGRGLPRGVSLTFLVTDLSR